MPKRPEQNEEYCYSKFLHEDTWNNNLWQGLNAKSIQTKFSLLMFSTKFKCTYMGDTNFLWNSVDRQTLFAKDGKIDAVFQKVPIDISGFLD